MLKAQSRAISCFPQVIYNNPNRVGGGLVGSAEAARGEVEAAEAMGGGGAGERGLDRADGSEARRVAKVVTDHDRRVQ